MTDGESLLRSVLLAPGDDTPRLVYADWLEENAGDVPCPKCNGVTRLPCPRCSGEGCSPYGVAADGPCRPVGCDRCLGSGYVSDGRRERAEFVRVQCQLASHPECRDECRNRIDYECHGCELRRRERELWKSPEAGKWFGDDCYISIGRSLFERGGDGRKPSALIHRGFVSEIRLPLAAFVGAAGELFSRHPITFVALSDVPPAVTSGLSSHPDSPYFGFGPEVGFTNANPHNRLPPPLFDLLKGYMTGLSPFFSSSWRFYATRDAALAALSDACVAYGRSQVDFLAEHDAKKELASVAI